MHIYFGLVAWGVVAFVIYKAINVFLEKRQLAGKLPSTQRYRILPEEPSLTTQ